MNSHDPSRNTLLTIHLSMISIGQKLRFFCQNETVDYVGTIGDKGSQKFLEIC